MQSGVRAGVAERSSDVALEFSDLLVRRARSIVFGPVSARIPGPGLVRLVGANGSGKSTLLRVLAGLQRPTSGRVDATHPVAFLPERFTGAPEFRVRHLMTAVRRSAASPAGPGWAERVAEALDVRPLMDLALGSLSHGQAQRSALAAVLHVRPPIVLLDEPFDGLDAASAVRLRDLLIEHAESAVVIVTDHDTGRRTGATRELHVDSGLWEAPVGSERREAPLTVGRVSWELDDGRAGSGRLTGAAAAELERLVGDGHVHLDDDRGPDAR